MNQNELEKKSADDFLESTMTNDDKKKPSENLPSLPRATQPTSRVETITRLIIFEFCLFCREEKREACFR